MKINKYICSFLTAIAMLFAFTACSPDDYSMGGSGINANDLAEGIAFKVEHDATNPNLVHLTNLKSGYNAYWKHDGVGVGHSKGNSVDLKIAFAGTYPVVYGIDTPQGVIYSNDTAKVEIKDFCAEFVSDDNWVYLTGGADNSKTWIPDDGNYGMKQGFYSCFSPDATFDSMTHDDGLNNWYAKDLTWWQPSNSDVGVTSDDLAQTMTFDLKGGANLTVTDAKGNATAGVFTFDPDAHALNAEGVEFAHGAWADGKSKSFSKDFYVFHLGENQLMIANLRDPALSGEGACWFVWNFVSKEYADAYKASHGSTQTEPELIDNWRAYVEPLTQHEMTFKLSSETPYDYANNIGTLEGITPEIVTDVENTSLVMNNNTGAYTMTLLDGNTVSAKYTLDDKGIYTFNSGLGSESLSADGKVLFKANDDNTLRILKMTVDDYTGGLSDLWLGRKLYDDQGNFVKYLAYHFVVQVAGADTRTKYKSYLYFNNTGWNWTHGSGVTNYQSDPVYIIEDGDYKFSFSGAEEKPYLLYIDCSKLLGDHPNCDVIIKDIKVDGTSVSFDDSKIDRGVGDDKTTFRRYVLNPWQDPQVAFPQADGIVPKNDGFPSFKCSTGIDVTVTVKLDTGTPVVVPSE